MTNTYYIAISQDCWARGSRPLDARRELKRTGGSTDTMLLYRIEQPADKPAPDVDRYGNVGHYGTCTLAQATKRGKRVDVATVTA